MSLSPAAFWTWFREFSVRISGDEVPDPLQDGLLARIQQYDDRLCFRQPRPSMASLALPAPATATLEQIPFCCAGGALSGATE
ncbi:hypothetical protein Mal4_46770 [Maioricimonas rarisocia]|uniref:Uncharacterized protein n=1 Tax=Maioricimonas rarisocia TaxID=2528026 RepID=A0A517ZCY6_9PLAN|nr:hypothetical protein [Maioricimonas rarisocia]QDU40321.1 hypothetical protein Mal4_46770 [Maioricimonas rarisocia]